VHALTGPRPIPSQMLHPLSRFLTSDFLSHGHLHHYRIVPDLLFRLTHAHRIYVPLSFSHPSSIRPLLLCTHSRTCICSLRNLLSHCYPRYSLLSSESSRFVTALVLFPHRLSSSSASVVDLGLSCYRSSRYSPTDYTSFAIIAPYVACTN
jgi:hypothetical protein